MEWFGRAWRGEERLWKVYWLYGWVYPFIFSFVLQIVAMMVPPVGLLGIIFLPYTIWWSVAAWRCAWNVDAKFWGYLVRILVVAMPLLVILGLLVGGVLAGQDLIKAAECRKAMRMQAVAAGVDQAQYGMAHAEEYKRCTKEGIEAMGWSISSGRTGSLSGSSSMGAAVAPAAPAKPMDACEQKMAAFAVQNNGDPQAYIAQNQAYLMQCRQSLAQQPNP